MKALVLTLLFLLMAPSEPKIFSRCEVASILKQHSLDTYITLDMWICISYYASKYNTQAVNKQKNYRSRYYGIFQISSDWLCRDNQEGMNSLCGKPCSAFTDDDITDDIACAKIIMANHAPLYKWWPWTKNCRGPNMSNWSSGCKL
ncbi:lysozyme C, milk isozyme-like [Pantherophis guttatus]|uniref:Lysozyme C, milk isozyme-like n=1 Tax=Pantherophis guttatus TaxID=94885 RepID=A0ABM3YTK3_PANGU|nr:lysozyme C, milk isozyme-like [Pantherophis guttatus]